MDISLAQTLCVDSFDIAQPGSEPRAAEKAEGEEGDLPDLVKLEHVNFRIIELRIQKHIEGVPDQQHRYNDGCGLEDAVADKSQEQPAPRLGKNDW